MDQKWWIMIIYDLFNKVKLVTKPKVRVVSWQLRAVDCARVESLRSFFPFSKILTCNLFFSRFRVIVEVPSWCPWLTSVGQSLVSSLGVSYQHVRLLRHAIQNEKPISILGIRCGEPNKPGLYTRTSTWRHFLLFIKPLSGLLFKDLPFRGESLRRFASRALMGKLRKGCDVFTY